jgi:hypothetical protein
MCCNSNEEQISQGLKTRLLLCMAGAICEEACVLIFVLLRDVTKLLGLCLQLGLQDT